jgi:hypothetical protein
LLRRRGEGGVVSCRGEVCVLPLFLFFDSGRVVRPLFVWLFRWTWFVPNGCTGPWIRETLSPRSHSSFLQPLSFFILAKCPCIATSLKR